MYIYKPSATRVLARRRYNKNNKDILREDKLKINYSVSTRPFT